MEEDVEALSGVVSQMLTTIQPRGVTWSELSSEGGRSNCREKLLVSVNQPVPQTDTGSQEENSKAIGRSVVKELGKLTP